MKTLTNPQALLPRFQKDKVAYDPPLPFTTVTVRWCAVTCTATPPSVAEHAAHTTAGAVVAGFGATVAFLDEGSRAAAVGVPTAAVDGPVGGGGMKTGARLAEPGVSVMVGLATTGAAPAHAETNRTAAAATTTPAADDSLFPNS